MTPSLIIPTGTLPGCRARIFPDARQAADTYGYEPKELGADGAMLLDTLIRITIQPPLRRTQWIWVGTRTKATPLRALREDRAHSSCQVAGKCLSQSAGQAIRAAHSHLTEAVDP